MTFLGSRIWQTRLSFRDLCSSATLLRYLKKTLWYWTCGICPYMGQSELQEQAQNILCNLWRKLTVKHNNQINMWMHKTLIKMIIKAKLNQSSRSKILNTWTLWGIADNWVEFETLFMTSASLQWATQGINTL